MARKSKPQQLIVEGVPDHLAPVIEALLFAATEPLTVNRLCEVTGAGEEAVEATLRQISEHLRGHSHGFEVLEVAGGYRLFTKREYSDYVENLLQPQKSMLTPPALETLAIIAYRQPVTRAEIEAIRGVQPDRSLRTLLEKGLIKEAGRKEGLGRPVLYATTEAFLEHFGLSDLGQLPPEPELLKKAPEASK